MYLFCIEQIVTSGIPYAGIYRPTLITYLRYHPLDEWFAIVTINFQRFPRVFPVFFISFLPTLGCVLWLTPTIAIRLRCFTSNFVVYSCVRTAHDSSNVT